MNKIILFITVFVAATAAAGAGAETKLTYRYYAVDDPEKKTVEEAVVTFKDLPDGNTAMTRYKETGDEKIGDDFVLDRDFAVIKWSHRNPTIGSEYNGERATGTFTVEGSLKGKLVDETLDLGNQYLHIYPNYTLSKFALSGMRKMLFWTLRRDEMSKLLMQAINKGIETIEVNGKMVEAIHVYYSITGKLRERYYNHDFYYRKSDGLFLKKEEDGIVQELVKEE